jgi:DNA-binding transcriptional regulator YdaS (Cro superfamily)
MTKEQAIKLAGSQVELALMLGISQAAVSQWGSKVPEMRVWQLKVLKPEWFTV